MYSTLRERLSFLFFLDKISQNQPGRAYATVRRRRRRL